MKPYLFALLAFFMLIPTVSAESSHTTQLSVQILPGDFTVDTPIIEMKKYKKKKSIFSMSDLIVKNYTGSEKYWDVRMTATIIKKDGTPNDDAVLYINPKTLTSNAEILPIMESSTLKNGQTISILRNSSGYHFGHNTLSFKDIQATNINKGDTIQIQFETVDSF
jgi:hypothetical protein